MRLKLLLKDSQFGAALGAAPLFWLLAWQLKLQQQGWDWDWPLHSLMRFLLPALIYPVLEELTFRGLIQRELLQQPWGQSRWLGLTRANWATSLLFGASHWYWHGPLQSLLVVGPGLVFGHFRDRYQKVSPSVLLHVCYNSGWVWLFAQPV